MPHEQNKDENSIGGNLRIIVLIAVLFILLLFAVHCTWVTSNAYSSPSVVLATYDQSGRYAPPLTIVHFRLTAVVREKLPILFFLKDKSWTIFVRPTSGCGKTLMTTPELCLGGIMVIK